MTWVPVPDGSPFPVQNLPFGVFSRPGEAPRVGVAIGDHILDAAPALGDDTLAGPTLNPFLARGRRVWSETRARLLDVLGGDRSRPAISAHLLPRSGVRLHLPFEVADYVDFYASLEHATNVGRLFRPGADPLPTAWRHQPLGYHGRAGTVVVSGTPVVRPWGQYRRPGAETPRWGPTERLDLEAEVGFVVGVGSAPGTRVAVGDFAEHVFGALLVNDWSARDLQAFEYVPLGPFLGKSFATSVSPWVVPLEALAGARRPGPVQDPVPAPHLRPAEPWGLDLALEIRLDGEVVSRPPFAGMYWSPAQMLAHLTSNGASLRTGDLYASGTVSGPAAGEAGSLLELTADGARPLHLGAGATRTFLEDGDDVTITATAPGPDGTRIGWGEVAGEVHPARPDA